MQQIGRITAEAPAAQVGRFQFGALDKIALLVEPVVEDLLDAAVGRRAEVQCARARGLESLRPEALTQAQQALRGA